MATLLDERCFGRLPSGEPVAAFTLVGSGGLRACGTEYGATLTQLHVPDRDGRTADVVLGFDTLDAYLRPQPYLGATVGRVAGRIADGAFLIDGARHELERNEPPNHLHGGRRGFDKRRWVATAASDERAASVRLTRVSGDGEERYPGSVNVAVTYSVTDDNRLVLDVEAATDRPTPFGLTNHSYFNLAGEGSGSIEDHTLRVSAGTTAAVDERLAPVGRREAVDGTAFDLRVAGRLGDAIPAWPGRHGALYFVDRRADGSVPAARLADPASGRAMVVRTTEACVQVYSGVDFDGTLTGKAGRPYGPFAGICLECEAFPGDAVLRPGRPLRHTTEYAFTMF